MSVAPFELDTPPALTRLTAGGFSIGLEAPLDNDWTPGGELARRSNARMDEVRSFSGYPLVDPWSSKRSG